MHISPNNVECFVSIPLLYQNHKIACISEKCGREGGEGEGEGSRIFVGFYSPLPLSRRVAPSHPCDSVGDLLIKQDEKFLLSLYTDRNNAKRYLRLALFFMNDYNISAALRISRAAAVISGCDTIADTTAAPFIPRP